MESGYFESLRTDMHAFVPPNCQRSLEIGCGTGEFISSLTECGEKWGIEPSAAAKLAEGRLTKVLNSTFDEAKNELPRHYFDLVICNDVIEHLPDHRRFFGEIGDFIAPGGMLIGSVPNVRFYQNLFKLLFEKEWQYTDTGILDRTHLAFFTENSLRRTIDAAGFDLVRIEGLNYDCLADDKARTLWYLRLAKVLAKLTLGYFSDTRCLQFGFQAIPRSAN